MPPRRASSTDRHNDTHENRQENAQLPPNRDAAIRVLDGTEQGVNLATLTLVRVKDIFYEKYFTADVRGRLKREFMSLRQGDMSMVEFIKKFDEKKPQGQLKKPGQQKPPQFEAAPKSEEKTLCKEFNCPNNGRCMWGSFKCFICKEEGYKAIDCPKKKGPTVGRAYVMHAKETEAEPDMNLINGRIFISGVAVYALLDLGATHSFISETFVKQLKILPEDLDLGFRVSILSGDEMVTTSIMRNQELRLQKNVIQADLIVRPMPEFDIILGMD
ncbi:uncharacterized protein LOC142544496 [Primulina tabacum]|uniref:uncharacterized protein LOC142544496 n=1 Tax=Primulina tabacum TaxID=48773 RepID=UPI003F592856